MSVERNTTYAIENWKGNLKISGSDDCPHVQLQLCHENPPEGPYMALRHCWGGAPILRLMKDKVQEMEREIPFKELPKTFRDAVVAAKRLDVQYLWIDSHYIIQHSDNDEDWLQKAARMPEVYRNAIYNLTTTHGTGSGSDLFVEREPLTLHPCFVDLDWSGKTVVTTRVAAALVASRERHPGEGSV
jgi:Heterokaryon incompatibility protein (HET)